jgi:hypothetical protein
VFERVNWFLDLGYQGMDQKTLDEKFRKIGGGHDFHTQRMS